MWRAGDLMKTVISWQPLQSGGNTAMVCRSALVGDSFVIFKPSLSNTRWSVLHNSNTILCLRCVEIYFSDFSATSVNKTKYGRRCCSNNNYCNTKGITKLFLHLQIVELLRSSWFVCLTTWSAPSGVICCVFCQDSSLSLNSSLPQQYFTLMRSLLNSPVRFPANSIISGLILVNFSCQHASFHSQPFNTRHLFIA